MKRNLISVLLILVTGYAFAQSRTYSLDDVINMAKQQSPLSKQAETRMENRYWQYRFFRSNYNPQLRANLNLPAYSKGVRQAPQNDGSFRYTVNEQSISSSGIGFVQPLSITGGQLSVNTELEYFRDYLSDVPIFAKQWNASVVNLRLDQPVFAFNQLRWDKRTEPLRYEESRRSYVEEMELISRTATERFFDVLDAQINLQIAEFNLANNDTIYKIEEGRYNIGTTTRDKLLQAELQLLRSRQDVTRAKINLRNAKLQLRSYIGLREQDEFSLFLPEVTPQLNLSAGEALEYARANRSAYIAFERRKVEADREVAQARGQLVEMNLNVVYGLNNTAAAVSDAYIDPVSQQYVNLSLSAPILDWGRNKARMRTALANKKLNDYVIEQDEIIFEQEIITLVSQFEVLMSQIEITKKSDEVANERYLVSQNRYLIGKIDITNLNIALTEKDEAKRSYVGALRSFWTSYYDLRRLTLYDFSTSQLLYNPDAED